MQEVVYGLGWGLGGWGLGLRVRGWMDAQGLHAGASVSLDFGFEI